MSRWLTWQPSDRKSAETLQGEPSKITKSISDGFDGSTRWDFQKIATAAAPAAAGPTGVRSHLGDLEFARQTSNHSPTKPTGLPRVAHVRPEACASTSHCKTLYKGLNLR